MRKESLVAKIGQYVEFSDNFTIRDERAVKKIASGLLKLLSLHGEWDKSELDLVMDIALEYRQRVRGWLHILAPGEFPKERLSYRIRG